MTRKKIWFAWACGLSKMSVEPLYKAAVDAGFECDFAPRGGYDDLTERMRPYTHYVFGVGPDVSWKMAREAGVVGINIMHGQYIFDTWRAPVPEHVILTGDAYAEDGRRIFAQQPVIHTPGYIRADVLKSYVPQDEKTIDCLVALPKIDEHGSLPTMELIESLRDVEGIVYRVHPRNSKVRNQLRDMGQAIDENVNFYDSLAQAKCLLSGPSNCIIESCIHGVPVGLFALPHRHVPNERVARHGVMQYRYFEKMRMTYEPIATIFDGIEHLKHWVRHPEPKPAENAAAYWRNTDGDIQPVIDCFLNILRETGPN